MGFKYEIVKDGRMPTWERNAQVEFQNPVNVGDKVKTDALGSELLIVTAIEHYQKVSILYVS